MVQWVGRRWTHWLVAVTCWFAGLVLWGATWATDYPDVDALPQPLQDKVLTWMVLDLAVGLLTCLLLPLVTQVRQPTQRSAILCMLLLAVAGPSVWALPAAMVMLVVVGAWLVPGWIVAALLVTLTSSLVVTHFTPSPQEIGLLELTLASLGILAVPVLFGRVLGNRRSLMVAYRERAEAAERERDQTVARVRAEERQAIARDMHDGLSHRLSLVSLHAGALAYRDDLDPEQVRESAATIQANVHAAAEELRQTLTVLRTSDDAPRPRGIDQVDAIVAEARARGSRINLEVDPGLELEALPALASVALARTVAEGLANAVKHAPASPVEVAVRDRDGGVLVQVTTQLAHSEAQSLPGGFGLVGLQERLAAAQGWVRAEAGQSEFTLRAWVPW
ncbi:hypothetical protein GCM10027030_25940 [Luteococcus sediminum]